MLFLFQQPEVATNIAFLIVSFFFFIAFIAYCILTGFVFIGITFRFVQSLKLEDLFAYKEGFIFVIKSGISGFVWFFKSTLLFLPANIIGLYSIKFEEKYLSESLFLLLLSAIFITVIDTLSFTYGIDITAQFFDERREKKIIKPLSQEAQ